MARTRTLLGAAAGAVTAYATVIRPWHLRFGTTPDERSGTLPGDEILPEPDLQATRAITIRALAEDVWPWLAQMGQGRGGLYSYDALENVFGCDLHNADDLHPEWLGVAVGDEFRLHPKVALKVASVRPPHALVVAGIAPEDPAERCDGVVAAPYDYTWAFVVRERLDGTSRLLIRERYAYRRPIAPLIAEPFEAASFLMTQKMLRGIRDRVEAVVHGPVVTVA